jgi:hypothetical protein
MAHEQERVRKLIESAMGAPDTVTGEEHDYRCPFCVKRGRDSTSHLHVNYRRDSALCHGCRVGFKSLLGLVRALYGEVPASLRRAALDTSLEDYCRNIIDGERRDTVTEEAREVALPDGYRPLRPGTTHRLGQVVLEYLRSRDMTDAMLEEFEVGYCAEGRMRGYSVFPVRVDGRLVTYTSRATPGVVLDGPKARHAPGSRSQVALLGYDQAVAQGARRVFVAEGPFSAWAFLRRAHPLDAGVSLLGKVLHDEQARLLDRMPCRELVVCLDESEHAATIECAAKLAKLTSKRVSYILLDPKGGDPHDERERLPGYIERRVRYDAMAAEVDRWLR